METWVRLWKSGDSMGIETNAIEEQPFIEYLSHAFESIISKEMFANDWAFQFMYWLPQATDIICKLRGYKNEVIEKRILIAGFPTYHEQDLIVDTAKTVRKAPEIVEKNAFKALKP